MLAMEHLDRTPLLRQPDPWFELALRTDNTDLAQARGYGLRLAFTIPL